MTTSRTLSRLALGALLAGTAFGVPFGAPAFAQKSSTAKPVAKPGASRDPLAGLDAYIQQGMKDWGEAGLSIAVVKDDSIVFARGYGVREVGKPDAVTPNTIFAIGSNSKLFTAVGAGMLVDEGKMKWDAPITTYLPWFQLYDPYVSREITVRDMLSHRSGLGRRGDVIWYGSPFDRKEILRRVRYLAPNSSFRSEFGYQNIMVMGAGEASAAAAGMSWDDLVKQRIFGPLGMTRTNTSVKALRGLDDISQPHELVDGKVTPIPWRDIDNIAPAGSINSSALDMAQWLRLLLADGKFNGKQLIKSETLREIEQPHTVLRAGVDTLRPSTHFVAYGLGVGMHDYMGVKVMTHTGGIDGMLSQVTWIPERKLGIVILTNNGAQAFFGPLADRIVDVYLGGTPRDWSAIALANTKKQLAAATAMREKMENARAKDSKPSLASDRYAGTYTNEMYPDFIVANEGGKLSARFGTNFSGPLEHWQYDTFRFVTKVLGADGMLATFTLDPRGTPMKVDVQGIGEFTRKTGDRETASQP